MITAACPVRGGMRPSAFRSPRTDRPHGRTGAIRGGLPHVGWLNEAADRYHRIQVAQSHVQAEMLLSRFENNVRILRRVEFELAHGSEDAAFLNQMRERTAQQVKTDGAAIRAEMGLPQDTPVSSLMTLVTRAEGEPMDFRQVADRYMPRALSRRFKVPWTSSAHTRMKIPQRFFENSFVRHLFGFSKRELDYLMKSADQGLKLKLLHLEVWAQMFLNGSSSEQVVPRLQSCISVTPEKD